MFIRNSLSLFQALQRSQYALKEPSSGACDRKGIFVIFFQAGSLHHTHPAHLHSTTRASKQTHKQTNKQTNKHSTAWRPNYSVRHVCHRTHSDVLKLSTQ